MTLRNLGMLEWGASKGMDLHRNYFVKFLIETDDPNDGPQSVTAASGLPTVGASWTYGNDNDPSATRTPEVDVEAVVKREKNLWWIVRYNFSTKPWLYCLVNDLINPLSQPDLVSGSFVNYQEKVCRDRNSKNIISSSLEPIWVNKDRNRASVTIQQVRANLELSLITSMIDTLNNAALWGLPTRCIKLRNVPWRRLVWGRCSFYYQRTLEFDIRFDSFDETEIIDMGHRWLDPAILESNPSADRTDPRNFVRATDGRGNVHKPVFLENGKLCLDPTNHLHTIPEVELYNESNFLLLGVPLTL